MLRASLLTLLLAATGCGGSDTARAAGASSAPLGWVDVRLGLGELPTLGVDGAWRARSLDGPEIARGRDLDRDTPITLDERGLRLGEVDLGPPPVLVEPLEGAPLRCGGVRYRGVALLEQGPTGARVVNRLPVDEYLRGVLPSEMPDRFGLEALKAQAVAARSYALSEANQRGWLYDDARSQVYGGWDAETWIGNRAVDETLGQVLTHEGLVFSGWFHSTCGGITAPAAEVFDDPPEGVLRRPVACPDCRRSPTWSWTRRIAGDQVCSALNLPPPLEGVDPSPRRFPGRPETVTVRAGGTTLTLRAADFRARVSSGLGWDQTLLSTCWSAPARIEGGDLVVDGRGWGHGVGLCQYGAAGYADRGAGYRVILRRYYPGADLVRLL